MRQVMSKLVFICVLMLVCSAAYSQEWDYRIMADITECELADGSIVTLALKAQTGPGVAIEYLDDNTLRLIFASDDIPNITAGAYNLYYVDVDINAMTFGMAHDINLICSDPINSSALEEVPVLSPDGNYLFFTRGGGYNHRIWMASKDENGLWSNPHQLPPPLDAGVQQQPGCFQDGKLYFISKNRDGFGGDYYEIWQCSFDPATEVASDFTKIVFHGSTLPTTTSFGGAYVTSDGKKMYAATNVSGVTSDKDILCSTWEDTGGGVYAWTNPLVLNSNVNGPYSEARPAVTDDQRILFFASYTPEYSHKLYYCQRVLQNAGISGTVTNASDGSPAYGVTIALYADEETEHVFVSDVVTDPDGSYSFSDLDAGEYVVEIVPPIGFDADPDYHEITMAGIDVTDADFVLTPLVASNCARVVGYWKHQMNVILEGDGELQETESDVTDVFPGLIFDHFYNSSANPIRFEAVTFSLVNEVPAPLSLEDMVATLSAGKLITRLEMARMQYLALLLNIVSGKVGQQVVISQDGVEVTQAVTYIEELIALGSEDDLWNARVIAETINHGRMLDAGMIPLDTQKIYYHKSARIASLENYPNPFNPATRISFSLSAGTDHELAIYDVRGALVKVASSGYLPAGRHVVQWDGANRHGQKVSSGMYFYRLRAADEEMTNKMILLR